MEEQKLSLLIHGVNNAVAAREDKLEVWPKRHQYLVSEVILVCPRCLTKRLRGGTVRFHSNVEDRLEQRSRVTLSSNPESVELCCGVERS